jgi:hypothetical protein
MSTSEYPVDGTIAEVEAWAGDDPDRQAEALARENERDEPRKGIVEKFGGGGGSDANDANQSDGVVVHGPGEGEPAAGDEDQVVESADGGGAVPVVTSTGPKLLALRNAPTPDAPEVALPVGGVVADSDVYAELVLAGTVTPTYQLVAKAGVIVNPGDVLALPPR